MRRFRSPAVRPSKRGRELVRVQAALLATLLAAGVLAACTESKQADERAAEATTAATTTEPSSTAPTGTDGETATVDPEVAEEEAWQAAQADDTVASYLAYLADYPDGRFAKKAKRRAAALREDDAPFLVAEKRGTLRAYERFLEEYPGHAREAEARAALKVIRADGRGRDVTALLAEGKIELEIRGSDITSVTVKLRRRVKHDVRVRIPAGTMFSAGSSSVQDMLALEAGSVELDTGRWTSVSLDAACADIDAAIPGQQDTFTVAAAPDTLRRLARSLRSEGDTAVRQAAVWIVSDDANFWSLGTLIYATGARVIGPEEAAAAMKLVDESGIDITARTIWADRDGILDGLSKGPLKTWLKER